MKIDWDHQTTELAANFGHLEALQWCVAQGCTTPRRWDIWKIAENAHWEVLVWLFDNGKFLNRAEAEISCTFAAKQGIVLKIRLLN